MKTLLYHILDSEDEIKGKIKADEENQHRPTSTMKEDLLQSLDNVDMEITKIEQEIADLLKKQVNCRTFCGCKVNDCRF